MYVKDSENKTKSTSHLFNHSVKTPPWGSLSEQPACQVSAHSSYRELIFLKNSFKSCLAWWCMLEIQHSTSGGGGVGGGRNIRPSRSVGPL